MPRLFLVLLVWLVPLVARADSFDIVTYKVPAGWQAQQSNGSLVVATQAGTTFSAVTFMPSHASDGSADRDFQKTWAQLAPSFGVKSAPQLKTDKARGWDQVAGVAQGTFNNVAVQVILVQSTANGRTIAILALSNMQDLSGMVAFLDSVDLDKGAAPSQPPRSQAPAPASGGRTTTFADGWTARVDTDYVEVTKSGVRVRLHYPVKLDDQSRANTQQYFWDKLIGGYHPSNVRIATYSAINFPYYFVTGDVRGGYVALRIIAENGTAYPIEVFAPSRADFERAFPDQDKLAAIRGANRFSVGADIAGHWTSSESGAVNLYYTGTGNYAGMNAAAVTNDFVFDRSGSYTSKTVGASGMIGNQQIGVEKHQGTWTASTWEITLKNEKDTTAYDAYYEAVRGGLILHMQNKKFSGMAYALGRAT